MISASFEDLFKDYFIFPLLLILCFVSMKKVLVVSGLFFLKVERVSDAEGDVFSLFVSRGEVRNLAWSEKILRF